VCKRVVVLDHGRVAFDGPVDAGMRAHRELLGVPV